LLNLFPCDIKATAVMIFVPFLRKTDWCWLVLCYR